MSGAAEILIEAVPRDAPEVLALYDGFIREADGPLGIDFEGEIGAGPPADLVAPDGHFLLARVDGEPAGIGGVRHLETEIAEVKSMYVSPTHRGLGLGKRLLGELHGIAASRSCRAVRLDTSSYLREAIALYTAAGYREVPDYNGNPKADRWFERAL